MSIQTKTTLKSYFETGDKPTQAQFADLIDSCYNVQQYEDLSLWPDNSSSNSTTLSNLTLNATSLYVVSGKLTIKSIVYGFNIVCNCNNNSYYTIHMLTNGNNNNERTFFTYCVNLNATTNKITVTNTAKTNFRVANTSIVYENFSSSNSTNIVRITQIA